MTEQEIRAYLATVWHEDEVPVMEATYTFEGVNLTEDDIKTVAIAVQQNQ